MGVGWLVVYLGSRMGLDVVCYVVTFLTDVPLGK